MSFEKIYILGLGYIGNVIINTLRSNNFLGKIYGFDINSESLSRAKVESFSLESDFDTANTIFFICVTPILTKKYIATIMQRIKNINNTIISDVASVKNHIFTNTEIMNCTHFVSIHPMCNNIASNIFQKQNLNYIIQNKSSKNQYYYNFLNDFLNFHNISITHTDHDLTVGITSHLSNIILACLNNEYDKINSQMWREIFSINKTNILNAISEYLNILNSTESENKIVNAFQILMKNKNILVDEKLYNPSLQSIMQIGNVNKIDLNTFKNKMNKIYDEIKMQ